MAIGEVLEALGRPPFGEIGAQHRLDPIWQLRSRNRRPDLAADAALIAGAAADIDGVALDHVLALGHAHAEQADIADIMLRAGMRAAGEMDIERLVERQPGVEMLDERRGVALGVARRKLTSRVAGAGDDTAAQVARRPIEPKGLYLGLRAAER